MAVVAGPCRPARGHAEKKAPPAVAICISGLLRSFNSTAGNILTTMVRPIRDVADVFMALDPRLDEYHNHPTTMNATEVQISEWTAPFNPLVLQVQRRAGQNEGLKDCLRMIEAEELARCRSYDWVVRLRPDVAYTCRLPTIEEWLPFRRAPAHAPKAHRPRPPWVLSDWIFVENYTTRSVAVKDVWAVMDRSAASVYMRDWPRKCGCNGEHGINEEDLGCTLSQGRVEVGAALTPGVPLRRIVRTWESGRVEPNCSACRTLRWNETRWFSTLEQHAHVAQGR